MEAMKDICTNYKCPLNQGKRVSHYVGSIAGCIGHWTGVERIRKDFKKNYTNTTKYPKMDKVDWDEKQSQKAK